MEDHALSSVASMLVEVRSAVDDAIGSVGDAVGTQARRRSDALRRLLTLRKPPPMLLTRVRSFGVDLNAAWWVAVIGGPDRKTIPLSPKLAAAGTITVSVTDGLPHVILLAPRLGNDDDLADELRDLAVAAMAPVVMLPTTARGPEALRRTYQVARDASGLAAAMGDTGLVMALDALYYGAVLGDANARRMFIELVLGPVLRSRTAPTLLQNLIVLRRCGWRVDVAAQHFNVHPNTVTYRATRVRDLTGLDPKKGMDRERLGAAILLLRVESLT